VTPQRQSAVSVERSIVELISAVLSQTALQILTNPKTALVRKRQMMQQLFGDYRRKMQEEEEATRKRQ
jgi:hypothetical protein